MPHLPGPRLAQMSPNVGPQCKSGPTHAKSFHHNTIYYQESKVLSFVGPILIKHCESTQFKIVNITVHLLH